MKRTNEEWISNLLSDGVIKENALRDLRKIILAGLPFALSKWIDQSDPRFNSLTEEVAQETILRVTARLDSFEGRSKFTTWVYTIAVRVALTELRRARWQEVSLEQLLEGNETNGEPRDLPDPNQNIETSVMNNEIMTTVMDIMERDLTEKQHTAIMAVAIHGMPIGEVARRMGTERNALYKLLHDARLKLKQQLEKQGINSADIIAAMEQ